VTELARSADRYGDTRGEGDLLSMTDARAALGDLLARATGTDKLWEIGGWREAEDETDREG